MNHVAVIKAANNVNDGVYFTDIGQKLIAQSLALAGALYQTGNINELDHCGSDLAGIVHIGKKTETKIRYGNHSTFGSIVQNGSSQIRLRPWSEN